MFVLEYRLNRSPEYPALFQYTLDRDEMIARMACGYLIRDGEQYKVISTATESDTMSVIYVEQEKANFRYPDEKTYMGIGLEIREWRNGLDALLVESKEFNTHNDILAYLHSDFVYAKVGDQNKEMQLDSTELDEHRHCYIFYGTYTGVITQSVKF